jgi:hypothetical protein
MFRRRRLIATTYPDAYPKRFTVTATRLSDRVVGPSRSLINQLLFAVLLLLLIACSNLANLLLVRVTAREKEMAVPAVIGASRRRLVQQFIMESLALCLDAHPGQGTPQNAARAGKRLPSTSSAVSSRPRSNDIFSARKYPSLTRSSEVVQFPE